MDLKAEDITQVCAPVVAHYARRCWWVDKRDLEQEAAVVALRACSTWEPAKGPFGPYARKAVGLWLGRWLLRQAPVSAAVNDVRNLIGVRRAPIDAASSSPVVDDAEQARNAAIGETVRRILFRVLPAEKAAYAIEVLLGERPMKEVAARHGVTPGEVLSAVLRARLAIAASPVLFRYATGKAE